MYYIGLSLTSILLCLKWGDWRNWKNYYPTILFFMVSNLASNLITYKTPLWLYNPTLLGCTFTELLIIVTIYPSTLLIYLPNFPNTTFKRIVHLTYYVAIYTTVEVISLRLGYFSHLNGWNTIHSILFNYIMFSILILHHKKPLMAWAIAFISPHILLYLFKIPYSTIR
jgi:hypothetical protein